VLTFHWTWVQDRPSKFRCLRARAVSFVVLGSITTFAQAPSTRSPKIESPVDAVTLRILVLDGKSGKPISAREVEIQTPGSKSPGELLERGITDNNGVFSSTTKFPRRVAVHVKNRYLCAGKNLGTSVQLLDDITTHGVVEGNSCNSKIQHAPEPGTLVLFVRRESLKEFLD
jgi:hypothetical protein